MKDYKIKNFKLNMIPETNNNQTNSILRFILILVFIGLAFLLFFLYQSRKKTDQQGNISTSITPPAPVVQTLGSLSFQSTSQVQSVDVDKALDLEIMASSEEKSVVGYDVVVKFEEGAVDIVRASSLLSDFSLYPIKKSDHYIITGVKKLSNREPTILDDTPMIRLTIMPKKSGSLTLAIVDKLGLEKTQMVDEKTIILVPKVGEITLEVR